MKAPKKATGGLEKKFQKVQNTPAGFDFYAAIHDFVEHIESDKKLAQTVFARTKLNKELNIPGKYGYLKQIYQGLEDLYNPSGDDIGHTRYAVLIEMNKIKNNTATESNSFWKKREVFRRITGEVYETVKPKLA